MGNEWATNRSRGRKEDDEEEEGGMRRQEAGGRSSRRIIFFTIHESVVIFFHLAQDGGRLWQQARRSGMHRYTRFVSERYGHRVGTMYIHA